MLYVYLISGGTLNDKICNQKELFAEEVFNIIFLLTKLSYESGIERYCEQIAMSFALYCHNATYLYPLLK